MRECVNEKMNDITDIHLNNNNLTIYQFNNFSV
jgi:hypothetical protein